MSDPYSLYPYLNTGHHQKDSRSIFYHLSQLETSCDITYIGCDIHLKTNYERIKEFLNLNLNIVCFPWFFLYDYFTFYKIESCKLKSETIPLKYNAIFLSGTKRLARYHIISELSVYDTFRYSNFEGIYGNFWVSGDFCMFILSCKDYLKFYFFYQIYHKIHHFLHHLAKFPMLNHVFPDQTCN